MKKYWIAFKLGWQDAATYRSEFWLSMVGWIVRLLLAIFIWMAVFEGKETVGSYNFSQMVSYFILMLIATNFIFSRIGFRIAEDIYTGDFANYLLKPISYAGYNIIVELGQNVLQMVLGFFVVTVPTLIFFPQYLPAVDLLKIGIILIVMTFAYFMNALITFIIGMSGFWVTNANRLMYVYFAIITAISGLTVPLDLFPEAAVKIMDYLPFTYIFFYPVKVMIAELTPALIQHVLVGQMMFLIILYAGSRFIYYLGVKKFEAVGR